MADFELATGTLLPSAPTTGDRVPVERVVNGTATPFALDLGGLFTPYTGDGTGIVLADHQFSLGTVDLSKLALDGATDGQAMVVSNGQWRPVTLAAGTVYTGTNGIDVSGSTISLTYGTTANTAAAGNDSRIAGALQAAAIPAANGLLLGGTSAAGAAKAIGLGTGFAITNDVLTFNGSITVPVATSTQAGITKPDGTTIQVDVNGTLSVVGKEVTDLPTISSLLTTDVYTLNQSGSDGQTTGGQIAAFFRKTQAPSRSVALPATLTASDNDKVIFLTGTTGTLTVDSTVTDGWAPKVVINHASGVATYSGNISGLQSTTALASGGAAILAAVGATVYASPAGSATATTATAYTTSLSALSGNVNASITITYQLNGGAPAGEVITPTVSGVTGTFSPSTVTTTAGSGASVSTVFTPTSTGTAVLSSTSSPSLTNTTGPQNYTVSAAVATSYTMTQSVGSGAVGSADVLTFAPVGGAWPAGTAITISATGVTNTLSNGSGGSLSGSVLTPAAGTSTQATVNATPTAAGTLTISVTNNVSLSNPTNLSYTASGSGRSYPNVTSAALVSRWDASDASTVITSGSNVTQWSDPVGGMNLTPVNGGIYHVGATVNGHATVVGDASNVAGSGPMLKSASSTVLGAAQNDATVICVFKTGATVPSGSNYTGIMGFGLRHLTSFSTQASGSVWAEKDFPDSYYQSIIPGPLAPNTLYKVIVRKAVASPSLDVWVNGTKTTYTVGTASAAAAQATFVEWFNSRDAPTHDWPNNTMLACEARVYNGVISDAEITSVVSELTSWWGS